MSHINTLNGEGGQQRTCICPCQYSFTRASKKALDSTAKIHSKVCVHMQRELPKILATPWPKYTRHERKGNAKQGGWYGNTLQPAQPLAPPAPVVPDGYLPGDGIIGRRMVTGHTGKREFTAEEKEEIRREIQERDDRIRGRSKIFL